MLAVGAIDDKPDYQFAQGVTFQVYGLDHGVTALANVYNLKGELAATLMVKKNLKEICFDLKGSAPDFRVLLVNVKHLMALDQCSSTPCDEGLMIIPKEDSTHFTVTLE